jgi:cytochrome bd-type quinol oxidase subunit 1
MNTKNIAYGIRKAMEKNRAEAIFFIAAFMLILLYLSAGLGDLRGKQTGLPQTGKFSSSETGRLASATGALILPAPEELQEWVNSILTNAGSPAIKVDGMLGQEFRKGYEQAYCIQQGIIDYKRAMGKN